MASHDKMIIYNLFPLLAGNFTRWKETFQRAHEMGFTWIFVNPVQEPGSSGSLYSIKNYYAFNPILTDPDSDRRPEDQVRNVLRQADEAGLKVMIDLVISHASVDSDLISLHPEWFVWEEHGRVANSYCYENGKKVIWKDLARFDHQYTTDREGLFQLFSDLIKYLIKLGFKGFRCDAAYQVPASLWKRLIAEAKNVDPEVLFFAETLGCPPDQTRETAASGFDYIFNSSKWWNFHGNWLMEQYELTRDIAPSISFPESHDTLRLCEELHGNENGLRQRYLFAALFSAGVMMPMGYEFGFRKKLHVVGTKPEDWEQTDIDLTDFISKVNRIKASHSIFQEEAVTKFLHHDNPNVLLMWKASVNSGEEALLILNKDIDNRQHFFSNDLRQFVQSGRPMTDISPKYQLDFIPAPFHYELRPGQGILLITSRQ